MNDKYYRIIDLLRTYATGDITAENNQELQEMLKENPEFEDLLKRDRVEYWRKRQALEKKLHKKEALRKFDHYIGYNHVQWKRVFRYVAVLFLPLIGVWWFWLGERGTGEIPESLLVSSGKLQAQLKLASGEVVFLDNQDYPLEIPLVGSVKGTSIGKELNYQGVKKNQEKLEYNTLDIPRGGMFKVILADSTVVYLNAETRLTYPVAFGKKKREVFLDGEAFFEVKRDTTKPFVVRAGDVKVCVYGTVFNVNVYKDSCVQTTLIEGKVGIVPPVGQETIIRPNEMAEYNSKEGEVRIETVNTRVFTAWRFGEFMFESESLESIMDQLARWYDVEVFYADEFVKKVNFSGVADRFSNIMDVLEILECTGTVKFSVKGRVIMVKSK